MTRPRLSVVVVTLNEEERLRACLESAAWADELIVVDALSPDKTAQIAREFTDRVIVRPWPGFAAQKNFAIGEASGDWILSLDADEMVSPELRGEIARVLAEGGPHDGYRTPRRNIFWGKWVRHGGLWPDWQLRLFRRGRGRFVERGGGGQRRPAGGPADPSELSRCRRLPRARRPLFDARRRAVAAQRPARADERHGPAPARSLLLDVRAAARRPRRDARLSSG
ncbi:MAG: hypothetical protein DME05_09485 [Candidatus Rokuibacteriota bacterium]|nr:MAG: hypothetical protein DME05_09485 [Candidatus Rokubacteria bacterium]